MGVLIDSDHLVDLERDEERALAMEEAIGSEMAAISVISVGELLLGALRSPPADRMRRVAFTERLLSRFEAIPIDDTVARLHADLSAALAADGASTGTHDVWIAATALSLDFGVATHNLRDFGRIPGLRVVSP